MPKSKFENVVFTIIMATIMVYGIGNEFSHGNLLSDVLLWPIRIYECIYEWTIFFDKNEHIFDFLLIWSRKYDILYT